MLQKIRPTLKGFLWFCIRFADVSFTSASLQFVSFFGIFDAKFGPKKLLNVLATVFVSVISTLSIIYFLGKESHVPLFFPITSFIIFHVFLCHLQKALI